MREVEVKIKISNPEETIRILLKQGCVLSEPIKQRDVVYIPNKVPTVPCPAGTNVLRIRYQGSKSLFSLKRSDAGNHLSKLEYELEISEPEKMDAIIKAMGFKIITDTTKTRKKCRIKDYEICVDSVNDLGDYLEIEKITDQDPQKVQQEMLKFLQDLGIDTSERINVGYDVLYARKYNL